MTSTGVITDAENRQPIAGAVVKTGQRSATTGRRRPLHPERRCRRARFSRPARRATPPRPDVPVDGVLLAFSWPLAFSLQPNTLEGTVTETDGQPVVDALVKVDVQTVRSGAGGRFTLRRVPDGAMLFVTADGYASGNAVFSGRLAGPRAAGAQHPGRHGGRRRQQPGERAP